MKDSDRAERWVGETLRLLENATKKDKEWLHERLKEGMEHMMRGSGIKKYNTMAGILHEVCDYFDDPEGKRRI